MIEDIDKKEEYGEEELGTFINLRTDFGFKKVFYDNEAAGVSFANAVIYPQNYKGEYIMSMSIKPVEYLGETEEDKHAIVDFRGTTNKGEEIIVEMQNASPMNFESRLIFYSTFPVREQAPVRKRKGQKQQKDEDVKLWQYNLKAVYIIIINRKRIYTPN
jgi:hypothetical protein